jgi:SulP family sulfate permease
MRRLALPRWLAAYDRGKGAQDVVAGIVVTILLVPQSLAYAMLAGLPPHVGMYASILPLVAYALLGSSMTLSVGPVAVASLMTASAVAPLAAAGSAEYVLLAMLLALMGGVVLLLLGLLRMGFVANLLSHPVISGFVTGSALLIALGQLKPLLGIAAQGERCTPTCANGGSSCMSPRFAVPWSTGSRRRTCCERWRTRHSSACTKPRAPSPPARRRGPCRPR